MSDTEESKETTKVGRKRSTKKSVSTAKAKVVKPSMPKRARVYTFEQWALRRDVPVHHYRGLKAFIKHPNKPRTLEEWDACFAGY